MDDSVVYAWKTTVLEITLWKYRKLSEIYIYIYIYIYIHIYIYIYIIVVEELFVFFLWRARPIGHQLAFLHWEGLLTDICIQYYIHFNYTLRP